MDNGTKNLFSNWQRRIDDDSSRIKIYFIYGRKCKSFNSFIGNNMFSAQQLNNFKNASTRKTISQKTFDEAVKENIDEFDMEVRAFIKKVNRRRGRR